MRNAKLTRATRLTRENTWSNTVLFFLLYQLTLSHALVTDCDRLEVVKTGLGGEKEVGRDFSLCGV